MTTTAQLISLWGLMMIFFNLTEFNCCFVELWRCFSHARWDFCFFCSWLTSSVGSLSWLSTSVSQYSSSVCQSVCVCILSCLSSLLCDSCVLFLSCSWALCHSYQMCVPSIWKQIFQPFAAESHECSAEAIYLNDKGDKGGCSTQPSNVSRIRNRNLVECLVSCDRMVW